MVGAIAVLGAWKVKTVAAEVEQKLKQRSAQEKLVVLQKVKLQEARGLLLEAILSIRDSSLQRLKGEYEENSDAFREYCEVLSAGDSTIGIESPPRGSELARKLARLEKSWGSYEVLAEQVLSRKTTGTAARRAGLSATKKKIDAATAKVDGDIDEVLVTVSDLANGTKEEVATIKRHATVGLSASVILAALIMLLSIWRSIEAQRTREMVVRHNSELEKKSAKLRVLYDVSKTAGECIDLDQLLAAVLRVLTQVGLFDFALEGAIYLVEGEGLRLACSAGCGKDFPISGCSASGECRWGRPGEHTAVISTCPGFGTSTCLAGASPHGHVLVPLHAAKATVGLLDLHTPLGVHCDEGLIEMLSSVGSQLGVAISNAQLYERAKKESLHDTLTGLPNRRYMDRQLERTVATAGAKSTQLSVIMFDIDHFKRINDTLGHGEGDRILSSVARRTSRAFRSSDQLFRYGGEEFLAILPDTDIETACTAAERVRRVVEEECGVTISIGVATYRHPEDQDSMIRRADEALYRAKNNGRNMVEMETGEPPRAGGLAP